MNENEDRFENYINEVESGTTCEAFLGKGKEILKEIRSNGERQEEFKVYKALGHKLRYNIYNVLKRKPMCTCALARLFQKPDSSITYHIKILQEADLIIGQKQSYFTVYHARANFLNQIANQTEKI